ALEAKAEAERASLSRSKFLAAASHDLRQPVQSLLLLIEVMKIRLAGTPMEKVTGLMESALDALRLLLDSLLDISKLDAGVIAPSTEEVDLGALLDRLSEEYRVRAQDKGLDLRVVRTTLTLKTDATLLERLLRNLLENALRYTPQGRILLGCRRGAASARLEVVDTGIGIAREHHDAVFEEFHQVGNAARDRSQGLGLGLAIVRRLAGLLGGSVRVRSELNKGARFIVELPGPVCRQVPPP
ncbi:MAG: HAMP domain-containing histidine kinase, partial [Magnetospirillum sp.]|nr:HAMP domain-containing histidine kinase [Magnetospirillum sp.]